jgi:drug/metabolite transporter (DMT)-like permease
LLPVVSVTLGAVLLDEKVGLRVLTGLAVVLVGVAMTRPTGARGTARATTTDPHPTKKAYAP